jgi:hypothetical protein
MELLYMLTIDSVPVKSEDIVSREIEGELLIVPIASGIGDMEDELYTLNETGREIWNLIDGKRTLDAIATDLSSRYETQKDEITRDVIGITSELVDRRILLISG